MAKIQRVVKDTKKNYVSPFKDYWNKYNYLFSVISLLVLVLGYFLMSQGPWDNFLSLTLSPIVLTVVYLVLIPVAILIKRNSTITKE